MTNRKQIVLTIAFLSVLASTPVALCSTSQVIYVAGDGTGNYNCDGTNDQVQINQALSYAVSHPGTTVYLKGPFVYDIESSCLIGSNTELTGDSTAKLRLHNNVGWTTGGDHTGPGTPMIGQVGGFGTYVHDIYIHGIELDGNEMNQESGGLSNNGGGHGLYTQINFRGSSNHPLNNINCYNMNIHDSKGDGFRVEYGTNISCYNDIINNCQHTAVMYSHVSGGSIKNNTEGIVCCSGDRLDNCQNIAISCETITPFSGSTHYPKDSYGFAYDDNGIQICDSTTSSPTKNIIVKNCNIKGGVNGIYIGEMSDGCNVNICNNAIRDSGYENEAVTRNGGIGITHPGNGITIQNNDVIGSYVAGINVNSAASGTRTVTVANNNIMNGKTGYAVKNSVASQVNLILTHNYLYANPANFYPSSLVNENPATSPNSKLETATALVQPVVPTANTPQKLQNWERLQKNRLQISGARQNQEKHL